MSCTKDLREDQISWGPKNSGDQMGLGTNSVTANDNPDTIDTFQHSVLKTPNYRKSNSSTKKACHRKQSNSITNNCW